MPEYKNSDMRRIIAEYVHNPKYRTILELRYCDSATYDEIASAVGYSTQHVKDICRRYKSCLISHL